MSMTGTDMRLVPRRRKDLTPYERAKTITHLAEATRQLAQREVMRPAATRHPAGEFRPGAGRKARGRPPAPGSYRDLERRTGLARSTIHLAAQHVSAAARYAELQAPDIPQAEAIAMATTLDRLPEPDRADKLAALRARRPGILAELRGSPPRPPGPSAPEATRAWESIDPLQGWLRAVRQIGVFLSGVEAGGGLAAVTRTWPPEGREALLEEVDQAIARLARLRTALRRLIDG